MHIRRSEVLAGATGLIAGSKASGNKIPLQLMAGDA
jgi:hypothetical protein